MVGEQERKCKKRVNNRRSKSFVNLHAVGVHFRLDYIQKIDGVLLLNRGCSFFSDVSQVFHALSLRACKRLLFVFPPNLQAGMCEQTASS